MQKKGCVRSEGAAFLNKGCQYIFRGRKDTLWTTFECIISKIRNNKSEIVHIFLIYLKLIFFLR